MWPAGAEHDRETTPASTQHSPWQSPVPYLFGGLAAMLGLIALSLLALACSYWKLSGAGEEEDADHHRARRAGDGGEKGDTAGKTGPAGYWWGQHVVVIMAGDESPSFLTVPASGSGRAVDDDEDGVAASCVSGGAEQGRCVEFGATARSAGLNDDAAASWLSQSIFL